MNLLQEMLTATQEIDLEKIEWPDEEPKEDETVVGTASEDLQRLWGAMVAKTEEADDLAKQLRELGPEDDGKDDLKVKFDMLVKQIELLRDIFWTNVRLEFPEIFDKCNVGLRVNGQVVWSPCDHGHGLGIEIIGVGVGPGLDLSSIFGGGRRG